MGVRLRSDMIRVCIWTDLVSNDFMTLVLGSRPESLLLHSRVFRGGGAELKVSIGGPIFAAPFFFWRPFFFWAPFCFKLQASGT